MEYLFKQFTSFLPLMLAAKQGQIVMPVSWRATATQRREKTTRLRRTTPEDAENKETGKKMLMPLDKKNGKTYYGIRTCDIDVKHKFIGATR